MDSKGLEDATPFPAMPDNANKSDSQPPSKSESVEQDGSEFFAQQGLDEDCEVREGQGGIFNFPSGGDGEPVRLIMRPLETNNPRQNE